MGLEHFTRAAAAFSVSFRPAAPVRVHACGRLAEGSAEWAAVDKALEAARAAAAKVSAAAAAAAAAAKAKEAPAAVAAAKLKGAPPAAAAKAKAGAASA